MTAYVLPLSTLEMHDIRCETLTALGFSFMQDSIEIGGENQDCIVFDYDTLETLRTYFGDPSCTFNDLGDGYVLYNVTGDPCILDGSIRFTFGSEELVSARDEMIKNAVQSPASPCYTYHHPTLISARWLSERNHCQTDDAGRSVIYFYVGTTLFDDQNREIYPAMVLGSEQYEEQYLIDHPDTLFGIRVPAGMKMLRPSRCDQIDRDIVSPEGVIVAQVMGNFVFVLTPAANPIYGHDDDRGSRLLAAISVAASMNGEVYDPDTVPLDKFMQTAKLLHENEARKAKNEMESAAEAARRHQDELSDALRRMTESRMRWNALKDVGPNETDLRREVATIRNMRNIKSIVFRRDGKVIVRTTPLVWDDDTGEHPRKFLGVCRVEIDPTKSRVGDAIRWFNETLPQERRPDGHHFPHVTASGGACLGNASEMLAQVVGTLNLGMLIQMAVSFAESANLGDLYGDSVKRFPNWDPMIHPYPAGEEPPVPVVEETADGATETEPATETAVAEQEAADEVATDGDAGLDESDDAEDHDGSAAERADDDVATTDREAA